LATTYSFSLTYQGIPFVSDRATSFRMPFGQDGGQPYQPPGRLGAPEDQQAEPELIDELNRIIPELYLQDIAAEEPPKSPQDRLARRYPLYQPRVRIGDWHYPVGASRWGVFRGLATSSQAKAMLAATLGAATPFAGIQPGGTLAMSAQSLGPGPATGYSLSSPMYLLPPRPMAEHGGKYDGLYLITLVDERWLWRRHPITLAVNQQTTWLGLLQTIANTLGIALSAATPPAAYGQPEPDSQLWSAYQTAPVLLDAVACTLGLVAVRSMGASYTLIDAGSSFASIQASRGAAASVVRTAGGDMFSSGTAFASGFPSLIGDLNYARNAVLPPQVVVTFPAYVYTDQSGGGVVGLDGGKPGQMGPVPHFMNARYANQRGTVWFEEGYGAVYAVAVPLLSGGLQSAPYNFPISGAVNSGLVGTYGTAGASGGYYAGLSGFSYMSGGDTSGILGAYLPQQTIRTTAKAMYSGEAAPTPVNMSGLVAAAMQIAGDFYKWQAGQALDEAYPGTLAWQPEGGHDIVWTYSERQRQAATRVMRAPWNQYPAEIQFAPAAMSGASGSYTPYTTVPPGVGGRSVAQAWRDLAFPQGGTPTTPTAASTAILASGGGGTAMASGDTFVFLNNIDVFPTYNRWKGRIDNEKILFEGTSGLGRPREAAQSGQGWWVDIAQRGIDGTLIQAHAAAAVLVQDTTDIAYGINLVTLERGSYLYPHELTSGGMAGVRVVPQVQTVVVLDGVGTALDGGSRYYSGQVLAYAGAFHSGSQYEAGPLCWVQDRMYYNLTSGRRYEGQFAAYNGLTTRSAPVLPAAPVYLVQHGVLNVVCDPTSGLVVFQ
jgi:hypothetical protein